MRQHISILRPLTVRGMCMLLASASRPALALHASTWCMVLSVGCSLLQLCLRPDCIVRHAQRWCWCSPTCRTCCLIVWQLARFLTVSSCMWVSSLTGAGVCPMGRVLLGHPAGILQGHMKSRGQLCAFRRLELTAAMKVQAYLVPWADGPNGVVCACWLCLVG